MAIRTRDLAGRLPLGRLVITPAAAAELTVEEVLRGLVRHAAADRGEDGPLRVAGEWSVRDGQRTISVHGPQGRRFWIITEADRSATVVLLPLDY
jgi:hypothetical protein